MWTRRLELKNFWQMSDRAFGSSDSDSDQDDPRSIGRKFGPEGSSSSSSSTKRPMGVVYAATQAQAPAATISNQSPAPVLCTKVDLSEGGTRTSTTIVAHGSMAQIIKNVRFDCPDALAIDLALQGIPDTVDIDTIFVTCAPARTLASTYLTRASGGMLDAMCRFGPRTQPPTTDIRGPVTIATAAAAAANSSPCTATITYTMPGITWTALYRLDISMQDQAQMSRRTATITPMFSVRNGSASRLAADRLIFLRGARMRSAGDSGMQTACESRSYMRSAKSMSAPAMPQSDADADGDASALHNDVQVVNTAGPVDIPPNAIAVLPLAGDRAALVAKRTLASDIYVATISNVGGGGDCIRCISVTGETTSRMGVGNIPASARIVVFDCSGTDSICLGKAHPDKSVSAGDPLVVQISSTSDVTAEATAETSTIAPNVARTIDEAAMIAKVAGNSVYNAVNTVDAVRVVVTNRKSVAVDMKIIVDLPFVPTSVVYSTLNSPQKKFPVPIVAGVRAVLFSVDAQSSSTLLFSITKTDVVRL